MLEDIPSEVDILITMGRNVSCPNIPSKYREDFGTEEPSGGSKEDFEEARELIKVKIIDLIDRVKSGVIKL